MFKNKDGKVSIKNCIAFEFLVTNFTSGNLNLKPIYPGQQLEFKPLHH
jgi:hypothetical protein